MIGFCREEDGDDDMIGGFTVKYLMPFMKTIVPMGYKLWQILKLELSEHYNLEWVVE